MAQLQAERAEDLLRLTESLAELPEGQRDAVMLHYWQGQTLAQVAEQLDKSVPSVAGLLQRGLKTLRSLMARPE